MAASYPAPGVELQTINYSQTPNPQSTSVGCIVFENAEGPITPQYITNTSQYLSTYGNPNPQVGFGAYQALAFLQQSQQLWSLRVPGAGASYAGLFMDQSVNTITLSASAIANPDNIVFPEQTQSVAPIAAFYALSPSSSSNNIGISISSNNISTPVLNTVTIQQNASATAPGLNSAQVAYQIAAVSKNGTTLLSQVVTATVNLSNAQATLSWTAVPGAFAYQIFGNTPSNLGFIAVVPAGSTTYVDNGSISPNLSQTPVSNFTPTPFFTVNVYNTAVSSSSPVESWECSLTQMTNGKGQQTELEQAINNYSQYINVLNNTSALDTVPAINSVGLTLLAGGFGGAAVTDGELILGMQTFANKTYNVDIIMDGGVPDPNIQQAWDAICHSRQDCMLFTSVPSDQQETTQAVAYRTSTLNLNSDRTALYSPDIMVFDPYNNLTLYVPPSGLVAAQVAYNDAVEYPWWSPAGLERGVIAGALGVRYSYDEGDRELLSPAQVNAIRNIPGEGIVIYDDKTLSSPLSALTFISVRRGLDYILNTLAAAYQVEEFNPDDQYLADFLITEAESVLEYVSNNQGISAYTVVSDASNNTAFTLGLGQRIITLIITPILPTQNIIIQGVVTAQGASFTTVEAGLFG